MLGSTDLPPFFMQTPVTISTSTHRAPGQCVMSIRAGDGTVLAILEKLLALVGKATLLGVAAASFPLLQVVLPPVFGYTGRPQVLWAELVRLGYWTSSSSELLSHWGAACPSPTLPTIGGCHYLKLLGGGKILALGG